MSIETLTDTILNQMPKMPKRSRIFFSHLISLLVSLRGRFNFTNLARYGIFNEATYRYHFAKAFDFMTFNQHLIAGHCSADRVIAFDPSYLPKSGKRTAGLGYFWSGCAQRVKKGLELAGFSCVDLTYWTGLHLNLPPGYQIVYGGSYAEQQQSFQELLLILVVASLLVFTVILFLFRDFKAALVIIFIAILGAAGSLLALLITQTPLNVGSYTGLIMIVGIIGENAIFTFLQYQQSSQNSSRDEAIVYSIHLVTEGRIIVQFFQLTNR